MNKSALLGLLVALVLPLVCYVIMKNVGEHAVDMPRRYFADSLIEKDVDGKHTTDTVWHQIPEFQLTNQFGKVVTPDSMHGKVWVVNTFFTRCPNICPGLTRNIRKLQQSFENPKNKKYTDTPIVRFLSISVDPVRDSVQELKKWADRFYVNNDNWDLLTGPRKAIYDLLLYDFKLSAQDGEGIDSNFIHTEKVMLVDRDRIVRGFYNGLDSVEMAKLASDIGILSLEKDRKKPSVFRQYRNLIPILIAAPIIVFLVMWFFGRQRRKEQW